MRILLYADPHWSVSSSIVRSRGEKYSTRLENLIQSIQWVEDYAEHHGCGAVICLGDFFDTAQLNSEEITALGEIGWAHCYHYFIAGNHEMGRSDQTYSSSNIFDLCPMSSTVTQVSVLPIYDQRDTRIVCVPYILEKNRKSLKEHLSVVKDSIDVDNLIVLSHNDIKGVQMGSFLSTGGFSVDEIQENCKLFINGHLHNGGVVASGVINLGNLTGQNFSEDAYKYSHNAMLIDTETHEVEWIENPYAFKFYKLDFSSYLDDYITKIHQELARLQGPAVITVKVSPQNELTVKEILSKSSHIVESRVIVDMASSISSDDVQRIELGTDHVAKFVSYIREELGESDILLEELSRISGEQA